MNPESSNERLRAQQGAPKIGDPEGGKGRFRWMEHVKSAFTENASLKFVAFVLALTVFILVRSTEDVTVIVDVRVEYNFPDDRVLVSQPPTEVQVTVKGTSRQTRRINADKLKPIRVNLTNHRRDEYIFDSALVALPEQLSVVRFTPRSIPTRFEPRVEATVPIEVERRGSVPKGFLFKRFEVTPKEAVIAGAKSVVEETQVIRTRSVSLTDKTASFQELVELATPATFVEVLEPKGAVTVGVTIDAEQVTRGVGTVAVAIRPGPDLKAQDVATYHVDPETVQVVLLGPRLAVEAVSPESLEAYVQVFADDVATKRTRKARVVVPRPAPGIGLEIYPEEVTVQPK